jgi:hypothetical protein
LVVVVLWEEQLWTAMNNHRCSWFEMAWCCCCRWMCLCTVGRCYLCAGQGSPFVDIS